MQFSPIESVRVNQSFTVQVLMDRIKNLAGWSFNLEYDPTILLLESVEEDDVLKAESGTTFSQKGTVNEKEGIVILPLSLGWDASAKAGNHKGIGVPPGEYNLNYPKQTQNTTILAIDANTGEEIWSYFIDGVAYRGGIIATEDLAIIPAADGNLYILNGLTGELLHKIFLNTPLTTQPTIGRNSDGEFQIYVINGGRGREEVGGLSHNQIPGSLIALGISEETEMQENIINESKSEDNNVVNSKSIGTIWYLIFGIIASSIIIISYRRIR